MPDQPELTAQFRSEYGRLCVLTAKAINAGYPLPYVIEAARAKGDQVAPAYVALRAQRLRTQRAFVWSKKAGVPIAVLVGLARESRRITESEWMLYLPSFSEIP